MDPATEQVLVQVWDGSRRNCSFVADLPWLGWVIMGSYG